MSEIFDTSVTFESLGLGEPVCQGLRGRGFTHPTTIQAEIIPPILAGKDVIGQAKTGTGKTAAFGLPLLQMADPAIRQQAIILDPTRELAAQVTAELEELGQATEIGVTCIVGGESMKNQAESLKRAGHIVVGTPGRVLDMVGRGQLPLNNIRYVVLDEVDRMLDIGFRDDIKKLLRQIKGDHQTIFVSATLSDDIERLGRSFMKKDAQRITTVSGSLTVSLVDQKYLSVEPWDKKTLLLHLIRKEQPGTTVVFCRTKATVARLTTYLSDKGIAARQIHGNLDQSKRNKVMKAMRDGRVEVLIASDLAARGLDVEHISHVINYDLPDDPEIYIHRIGRTARAGRRGVAWSFVTPEQGQLLTEVEKLTGALIEKMDYPDFEPGPVPADVREERAKRAKRREEPASPAARVLQPELAGLSEQQIEAMFPGGAVPKSMPQATLGARFRRRR